MKSSLAVVLLLACACAVLTTPALAQTTTTVKPVITRDIDNAARHPVQVEMRMKTDVGTCTADEYVSGSASYHVPVGKQLVIETVTGSFLNTGSDSMPMVTLYTWVGGNPVGHYLSSTKAFQFQTQAGITDYVYQFTSSIRLYGDSGTSVFLRAWLPNCISTSYTDQLYLTISGYLVDAQ